MNQSPIASQRQRHTLSRTTNSQSRTLITRKPKEQNQIVIKQVLVTQTSQQINTFQKKDQNEKTKKGMIYFKIIGNIIRKKKINQGFEKIRLRWISLKQRTKMFWLKLKKIGMKKMNQNKIIGFKELLNFNINKNKQVLKKIGQFNQRNIPKNVSSIFNVLLKYYKSRRKLVFSKLIQNKNQIKKLQNFKKTKKLKKLHYIYKKRKIQAFEKLLAYFRLLKQKDLRILKTNIKIIQSKINILKINAFQQIRSFYLNNTTKIQPNNNKIQQIVPQKKRSVTQNAKQLKQQRQREQKQEKQIENLQRQIRQSKLNYQKQINNRKLKKQELLEKIKQIKQESQNAQIIKQNVDVPKSDLQQIYENVYQNLLFFLQNSSQQILKADLLKNLLTPKTKLDIPIETIKLQNQCLNQLIEYYRKMKIKLPKSPPKILWNQHKTYDYLLKQNNNLYITLSVLIQNNKKQNQTNQIEQVLKDFAALQQKLKKVKSN